MRKIIFLLFIVISFNSHSQELNQFAKAMKDNSITQYNGIKQFAQDKWVDDHKMILWEINQQSEAFYQIGDWCQDLKGNETKNKIWAFALKKWLDDPEKSINSGYGDWKMVLWEINQQEEAANQY